ncbi:probable inactive receptor-like protein kinase At3g56050 isoform X3 [Sorghum bicolor]|uniref:probable inactive receptor-like protein kinase At3g56050 isoform X3 n=1 Tax=Sorghum bicolor TaxID=4558 RepID=UPI000B4253BB|nr:probable inactive receptor-like protein kinase At3g56050 isoform X3 [Sorghum bicolor]|eukprot:XP_021304039.1 probable inactive receptor-like protein kinase At3g56050 isoform X3 [Sorghum bicolor]
MLLRSTISPASMEKTRRHRVLLLGVLLLLVSGLPDLGSCNDGEQGGTMNPEEGIASASEARKFLQEQQQQNRYWAGGHFGNKAASLPDVTTTIDQWPPSWLPWAPKAATPPMMSFPFPPTQAPAPSPAAAMVSNPWHSSITLPPQPPAAVVVPAGVGSKPVVAGGGAARPPHSGVSRPVYVIAAAGASLVAAMSVALFVLCYRSNKVVTVRPWATGLSGQLQKAFVTGVPSLKRSELEIACEDFSNVIGTLSDYMVYKGTLSTGVEIAVVSTTKNSAKEWSKHCESQFRKKITSLSRVNHKNFINLLGYCQEEQPFTRMMVFEYAPNGTLFEHLHVREDGYLDWPTRLRVAVGVAYCLEHMHQLSPPEILRALDTSTICLTDDFAAKISDVVFCDEPRLSLSLSPAAMSDRESVVYSYGMVLLETMTGRFTASSDGGLLESWAAAYLRGERQLRDVMDPALRRSFHAATVDKLDGVIRGCTDREPRRRLAMPEVAKRLREITAMPPDAATPKVSPLWWAELEIISTEVN